MGSTAVLIVASSQAVCRLPSFSVGLIMLKTHSMRCQQIIAQISSSDCVPQSEGRVVSRVTRYCRWNSLSSALPHHILFLHPCMFPEMCMYVYTCDPIEDDWNCHLPLWHPTCQYLVQQNPKGEDVRGHPVLTLGTSDSLDSQNQCIGSGWTWWFLQLSATIFHYI